MVANRRRNSKGIRQEKKINVKHGKDVMSAQMLQMPLIESRSVAQSLKRCVVNTKTTKASNK